MSALSSSANPDNANPTVYAAGGEKRRKLGDFLDDFDTSDDSDGASSGGGGGEDEVMRAAPAVPRSGEEPIDNFEIYDLIRSITDPEHPLTLEQLAVVNADHITVSHGTRPSVKVVFTPTIPHCSMATLIGLTIRVRLLRSLPDRFKVDIRVKEGSHESENSLNKQLNDKERVAAALENNHLLGVVENCLATSGQRGQAPKET